MSGTFPTTPGFKTTNVESTQPILVDIAQSGKRQSRIIAGHLWRFTCEFPPMTRDEFAPIYAFCLSQRGDSFQMSLPQFNTPLGVATGTPFVDGAHVAGDSTINIDGWTPSITGILKAGSLIKFANHSKVYITTADVDSGIAPGLANIPIDPPLIVALIDNEVVTVNNVQYTVALEDGVQEFKTGNPSIYRYAVDLIESL